MSKILTAEEFINTESFFEYEELLIKFAKLHIEACKKEMCKKFADQIGGREGWGNEIIMSVYSLDNIK